MRWPELRAVLPVLPATALECRCIASPTVSVQVWAGYSAGHPLRLFEDMARQWSGWPAELSWESLEGELSVRCSHDRRGHISIRVEVRSGCMPDDWQVLATVMAEAGSWRTSRGEQRHYSGGSGSADPNS
jgi:hypothetical protein